ncbi:segregation/condensation protein A [Natribacillus halophilus]|uniref:Segregation and condensation protein A n=1 Tax=Natribacillus halophilus TaxID=549003 RepID=A0A1G8JFQ0_9BACI|nr:segregation/condensation protein A [Natribacillus halophilus]SDI30109.1 condensin subunit ScpA [Natribacillus halophilus]
MQTERYNVKLDSFEGPLDLLLHLIKQAEVDIYDIPVAQITEQYMSYIQKMQALELDVASEYLVMASTLLAIKSQMLLPSQEVWDDAEDGVEEWGEEDPREELVAQLQTYRRYKAVAAELRENQANRAHFFSKPPSKITLGIAYAEEPTSLDVSLADMLQAYENVKQRLRLERPRTTTVETQKWSVEEKMQMITSRVWFSDQPVPFLELYAPGKVDEQVISFMALLQLVKEGHVRCKQGGLFADIYIEAREDTTKHE